MREAEDDAHGLAFIAQIVEHDALGGRRDFLQPERGGRKRIEARLSVGFEFGAAFADLCFAAAAFERRIIRIEIEQRGEIVIPARVQPIHHQRYLIEIISQIRDPIHVTIFRPGYRGGRRSMAIVLNRH